MRVKNKKTGDLYEIINDWVINATNKDDGKRMVLYKSATQYDQSFIREYDEFWEKFEDIVNG